MNDFPRRFLYKNFTTSAIIAEGVKPTLSELERFEEAPEGIDLELSGTPATGITAGKDDTTVTHSFSNGDNVEVCEGELMNLQGKIVSIDGNMIMVMPKHEELKEALEFQANELRKYFTMGDHVKVSKSNPENMQKFHFLSIFIRSYKQSRFYYLNIWERTNMDVGFLGLIVQNCFQRIFVRFLKVVAGRYEGDTGLIVRVEPNRVVLFSDLSMHELEVLPRDLQLCSDMATGVDSLGQFQWGDLVQLDPQTVGVIVRLERENFHVLSMHSKIIQARPQGLTKRRENRNTVALDYEQNTIQKKDIVNVVDGLHAGRDGEIKHLYRSFAFLHSRLYLENGGIFVCKTRHLQLAGGNKSSTPSMSPATGFMSPRIASPMHPSGLVLHFFFTRT